MERGPATLVLAICVYNLSPHIIPHDLLLVNRAVLRGQVKGNWLIQRVYNA